MTDRMKIVDPVKPGDHVKFTEQGIRRVDDREAPYDGEIIHCAQLGQPVVVTKDPEGPTWTMHARLTFR